MAVERDEQQNPAKLYHEWAITPSTSDKCNSSPGYEPRKRSLKSHLRLVPSLCLVFAILYFINQDAHLGRLVHRGRFPRHPIETGAPTKALEVFQVYAPVAVNNGDNADCTMLLMEHSFGYSYGKPFVGNYDPPSCEFDRVVMNFTVTSRGRQFDRLALMYLNDTEIWRTSTAEPTAGGIEWTYMKDMTPYLSLWKQPQKVIFDLGNLIDDTYTGFFNTTLTLTFLTSDSPPPTPADLIFPLSAQRSASNSPSVFTLPAQRALTTISLPRNANRAILSLAACGQADEEFWWSNVFSSSTGTFSNTTGPLPGFSPWREIQVLIDGQLAGVQWPFPVIFTGGVVPGLWRPIVGIEAFDLREYEIDVSLWLGLLSDGLPHTFEILVVGISDGDDGDAEITETVGNSWLVTGKVFLWLDEPGAVTKGSSVTTAGEEIGIQAQQATTQNKKGVNESLSMQLSVHREIFLQSTLTTAAGTHVATWSQQLSYTNLNSLSAYGVVQSTYLTRRAKDTLTKVPNFPDPSMQYTLAVNSEYHVDPANVRNIRINATLRCEKEHHTGGGSVFPSGLDLGVDNSGRVKTTQQGKATYVSSNGTSSGSGATQQIFVLEKLGEEETMPVYSRDVGAKGGKVVWDRTGDKGLGVESVGDIDEVLGMQESVRSVREVLGRGPGRVRVE